MVVSDRQRKAIQEEYDSWVESQYAGKDKKERQKLGQFFTPPVLSIKMLEKFDTVTNKTILDPTIGCGGLIAAAILAGANPKMCYGIELDPAIAKLCKERLGKLGVPEKNIKVGDALDQSVYDSFEEPEEETKLYSFVKKIDEDYYIEIFKDSNLKSPALIKRFDANAFNRYRDMISGKPVYLLASGFELENALSFRKNKPAIPNMIEDSLDQFSEMLVISENSTKEFKVEWYIVNLSLKTNRFAEVFSLDR